jgi:hypothetical protein
VSEPIPAKKANERPRDFKVTAKKDYFTKINGSDTTGGWPINSCILAQKYSPLGAYESSSSWIRTRCDVSWMGAGNSQSSA